MTRSAAGPARAQVLGEVGRASRVHIRGGERLRVRKGEVSAEEVGTCGGVQERPLQIRDASAEAGVLGADRDGVGSLEHHLQRARADLGARGPMWRGDLDRPDRAGEEPVEVKRGVEGDPVGLSIDQGCDRERHVLGGGRGAEEAYLPDRDSPTSLALSARERGLSDGETRCWFA